MLIQNCFNFGNSSFVVQFMVDQTGVLFLGHLVNVYFNVNVSLKHRPHSHVFYFTPKDQ